MENFTQKSKSVVEILHSGLWSSIQDQGRIGHGGFGVPQSGAMDTYSFKFANMLMGNSGSDAAMEIFRSGILLKFHENTLAAVSGLEAEILLNGKNIQINETFLVRKHSILEIKKISKGNWVYLAVFGGFKTKKILNSRSMYDGITPHAKLEKSDFLEIEPFFGRTRNHFSRVFFNKEIYFPKQIQVFPGPEFSLLSQENKDELFQNEFTISPDGSRMACLLKEKLENNLQSILTGPVLSGTVELTPSGQLIILMRDAPVTGGYPRILQVAEESLNHLAQKTSGEKIKLEPLESFRSILT